MSLFTVDNNNNNNTKVETNHYFNLSIMLIIKLIARLHLLIIMKLSVQYSSSIRFATIAIRINK